MSNQLDNARLNGVTKCQQLELTTPLKRDYVEILEKSFPVDLGALKVWDSGQPLPAAGANDDLGFYAGTWATKNLYVGAGDVKTQSGTRRARFQVALPENYVAGQPVTITLAAGMITTIADGSCTVDVEAYLVGRTTSKSGSDLVTTAAIDINVDTTFADRDFALTSTALQPGDVLDVRVSIAYADTATGTAVDPAIAAIDLTMKVRG